MKSTLDMITSIYMGSTVPALFGDERMKGCSPHVSRLWWMTQFHVSQITDMSEGIFNILLPNEVQQSVSRAGHWLLAVLRVLLLGGPTGVYDVDHEDAHHHSNKSGPQIVGDGHDAQTARALGVQRSQT